MNNNTLNLSAAVEAGFTVEEILTSSPEDMDAFIELFPGPVVVITAETEAEFDARCERFEKAYDDHIEEMSLGFGAY